MSGFPNPPDAPAGSAGGDLTGTYPSPTVKSFTSLTKPAAYTQTYATASRTMPNDTASAVPTDAATAVTPFGYTEAQANAIVAAVNAIIADLDASKKVTNQLLDDLQAYGILQ